MRQKRALLKHYPAFRYKHGEQPVIVQNKKEDDEYLGDGWLKTPLAQVLRDLEGIGITDDETIEDVTKVVNRSAAAVNMLARLSKIRSKKDLYMLADLLNIEVPQKASLKELRAIIEEESKNMPLIDDMKEELAKDDDSS